MFPFFLRYLLLKKRVYTICKRIKAVVVYWTQVRRFAKLKWLRESVIPTETIDTTITSLPVVIRLEWEKRTLERLIFHKANDQSTPLDVEWNSIHCWRNPFRLAIAAILCTQICKDYAFLQFYHYRNILVALQIYCMHFPHHDDDNRWHYEESDIGRTIYKLTYY